MRKINTEFLLTSFKKFHQTFRVKMRQISLGINRPCSNCPRVQIISELYNMNVFVIIPKAASEKSQPACGSIFIVMGGYPKPGRQLKIFVFCTVFIEIKVKNKYLFLYRNMLGFTVMET
jgi:hypothetical protein